MLVLRGDDIVRGTGVMVPDADGAIGKRIGGGVQRFDGLGSRLFQWAQRCVFIFPPCAIALP